MKPDSFFENGKAAARPRSTRRPLERPVGRRARHRRDLGPRRCAATARSRCARRCRPGIARRAQRLRVDQTFFDQTDAVNGAVLRRHPVDRGDLPRPGRHAARRRHDAAQPGPGEDVRATSAATAPAASTTARSPTRSRRRPQHPPISADRRPHVAARPDDRRATSPRYDAIEREPTHVDYRGLDVWGMGPPSSGGSTVGEALNILKGFADSAPTRVETLHRYLEASRYAYADRNAYLARPGVRTTCRCTACCPTATPPSARALIGRRRRAVPPAIPYAAGAPPRRRSDARRAQSTTHLTRRRPQGQRRDLHVHDRVDRRQRHRRARLRASCSTTS